MEDSIWRWIAMEWAEGGDLFDKIGLPVFGRGLIILDPDVGVDDDIAQFYFMQLISAMVYCSSPRR